MNSLCRGKHRGVVLLLALVMLLLLSMLATSGITSGNISSQLVYRDQRAMAAERSARNTINYLLSEGDYFINYPSYLDAQGKFNPILPSTLLAKSISIEAISLVCIAEVMAPGCSLNGANACAVSYYWQIEVQAADQVASAVTTISQGVRIDYLPGHCPI